MRGLVPAVLVLAAICGPATPAELLQCRDIAGNGFVWDGDSPHGRRINTRPKRYMVTVESETERAIATTTGDTTSDSKRYTCRRPYSDYEDSPDAALKRLSRQIVCVEPSGNETWIFHDDTFVRGFLHGPPAGAPTGNIFLTFGTCSEP